MSAPLVFVSHSRVKPGRTEQLQEHLRQANELIEREERRIIGFNTYVSEDGTDVATVQVHPDADSLDTHIKLFQEKLASAAFEILDSYAIDIYGSPSDATLGMVRQFPGIEVRVLPEDGGGFLRA